MATLDPERPRPRQSNGPFRLSRAIYDAITAAWLYGSVADLDPTPSPGLSLEERHRFTSAINQYRDVAAERDLTLHARSGDTLTAPSADQTYVVTARPDLLFRRPDGNLEVHRVMPWGAPAMTQATPPHSDLVVAALARRGEPEDCAVIIVRLWTEDPVEHVEHIVTGADIDATRTWLRDVVASARSNPTVTRPGYCCNDCPAISDCDAVPSIPIEQLLRTP
jgi:hypothetical protein